MKKYDLDKIRAISILDVAEKLGVEFKKKGINNVARCLWHEDSHPSMIIGGKYNRCHCYACGCTHGVIDLVMQHENTDFVGACEWLEARGYDILNTETQRHRDLFSTQRHKGHKGDFNLNANPNANKSNTETQRHRGNFSRIRDQRNKGIIRKTHMPPSNSPEGENTTDTEGMTPAVSMEQNKGDRYRSSFARCLTVVFGEEKMRDVVETYYLSAWKAHGRYDDVLFPSIDIRGVCRDLKAQGYDCDTRSERFFHRLDKVCYWIGNIIYPDAIFDRNCLFGEHLLDMYPEKTVILVESPKNACVGYAQYPQYVWVAAGNKAMLNRSVLEVLRGRKVIVMPDNDAFEEWSSKLNTMQDIASFYCMEAPSTSPRGEHDKSDIADWIISRRLVSRRLSGKCEVSNVK